MAMDKKPKPLGSSRAGIAEKIIQHADRDIFFSVKILGESRNNLQQHFQDFIRCELEKHNVSFGDHPLLLPFIETHGCELTDFVTTGVALEHQMSIRQFEKLSGDPLKLFRVDLWDSLSQHIERAEAHFISGIGGLQKILTAVAEERSLQKAVKDRK
ncbi:MAG: hypothetical protein ACR2O4_06355 [Hyphomicrobiaceae bacterium]